jgi:hypothetical protein
MKTKPTLTKQQTEILKHSVGFDSKKPGFRNYFCANIGSDDHATCRILEGAGLMEAGLRINGGRDQYFLVNRAGGEAIGLDKAAMKRLMEL